MAHDTQGKFSAQIEHAHSYFPSEKKIPVKRWPTDLAVPGSSPAGGGNLSNCKRGSIAHSLSLSLINRPDVAERLLKRT